MVSNFLLLTTCLIIHQQHTKDREEICIKNHFQSITTNYLCVCYINNYRDHSIFVWFTIEKFLLNIFHAYRFTLRSIDAMSLSTINIHILTNFTQLIDINNSLHILNLNSGQYEICIDFQSYSTSYIYSPRTGCIFIRRGELLRRSFKQNSTQLFIALAIGIVLFLIIGIIVQLIKIKRTRKHQQLSNDTKNKFYAEDQEQKSPKSSSILSTVSLKKQHKQIVRKLFHRQIDQSNISNLRSWIFNRAFHHRSSIKKQEIKQSKQIQQRNKQSLMTKKINFQKNHSSSMSTSTTYDIYTIPRNKYSRKISFYLTPSEEFELI
ncbi:unnamed protein product [Rotaria sp. Silwood1]|nr:unnamed protein product [Rotaria sp. Silwood1]CAF3713285.1 unnamed protein product [Rotaria sp. Silwood1]CAF5089217.1 unnamed protein product [Rotaria sp. Silwood1]